MPFLDGCGRTHGVGGEFVHTVIVIVGAASCMRGKMLTAEDSWVLGPNTQHARTRDNVRVCEKFNLTLCCSLSATPGWEVTCQVASSPTLAPYLCGLGAAPGSGSFGVEADRRPHPFEKLGKSLDVF